MKISKQPPKKVESKKAESRIETTQKMPAFKPQSGVNEAWRPVTGKQPAVKGSGFSSEEPSSARAARLSGAPKGPPPVFTGFDDVKLAAPLVLQADGKPKSAKYTFAKLAQAAGTMPRTKEESEIWFKQHIKPGMEAAGFQIDWVKGDKAMIHTRENPGGEVVDFVRGAGSNDPSYQALAWQPEGDGSAAPAAAAAGGGAAPAGDAGPVRGISAAWKAIFEEILGQLEAENPELFAANVSPEERKANMSKLRDKFVAASRAKGIDVGWNMKRGDGPLSIDAVAFRTPEGDGVLDIGQAYDDVSRKLKLQVLPVGGKPGYTLDNKG
jgi:hypothetical protein